MQVVELADAGIAGLEHLDIDEAAIASTSSGESTSRKRYISRRQVQKLSRPRPAPLGHARHRPLEGVAVQVRHRRQQRAPGQPLVARRGCCPRLDRADASVLDGNAHVARPSLGHERVRSEESRHARDPRLVAPPELRRLWAPGLGGIAVQRSDFLITNAAVATVRAGAAPYGLLDRGEIAVRAGRIAAVGPALAPAETEGLAVRDLGGRLVTPAPIDCHTHLVFAGDRAREFELRLEGASYEEIARAGGGIASTVAATRAATFDTLLAAALTRVDALLAEGTATIEIKSGYGLDRDTELRLLRVAREIPAPARGPRPHQLPRRPRHPRRHRPRRLYRHRLHPDAARRPCRKPRRRRRRLLRRHRLHPAQVARVFEAAAPSACR